MLSSDQKQVVLDRLNERFAQKKGAHVGCPMCGSNNFALLDTYIRNSTQDLIDGSVLLGGTSVYAAAVYCQNCGFISQHALGVLGLLPPTEKAVQQPPPEKSKTDSDGQ